MTTHGIMFHHFYDGKKHIEEQGALSAKDFQSILNWYLERFSILNADEFKYKTRKGILSDNDVCITFDDNLLCQYDIAIPILDQMNIKAFFFVYTSPLQGQYEKLEIYRHFRNSCFSEMEDFYSEFYRVYELDKEKLQIDVSKEMEFDSERYLIEYPFYTLQDRRFRYYRDVILESEAYFAIMDHMIENEKYDICEHADLLWCKRKHIKDMSDSGHIIGLHSHTHPTCIEKMDYAQQFKEYELCRDILENCINKKITTVSYPCGSVNSDTKKIMKTLGIDMGFRERMIRFDNPLMMPREDSANILRRIRNENNCFHK